MTIPLLRTLDQIEGADFPLVGGKAFRLATLKQHRFTVPPGLVLTAAFFEAQLQHCQLIPLWAGSPDVAVTTESLEWLANTIKLKPFAPHLLKQFNAELGALFGLEVQQFVVRSSAIDEDQRDHTFAGVHLTELGVPRSILPIAITRCWASALSGPAIKYRQSHGMSIQRIRIAVLIQPMLAPHSSGVAFTVNPLTGNPDELIIEATHGLGEGLVSGDIQPYFYRVSAHPPDYPLLEQRTGGETGQSETEPLSAATLTRLALQLERIQALMGEPQDVEWVWQDGAFHFLQTRPVSLPPEPIQTVDQEWSRASYPEFLPELPSPLYGSLLERSQKQALTFFETLGFKLGKLGPYVRLILGRPYLNLTILKRVMSQVGVNPVGVLQAIGHTGPETPGSSGLSIDGSTVWEARRRYQAIFRRMLRIPDSLKDYKALVTEAEAFLADTDMEAPQGSLLTQLRQHELLFCEHLDVSLGVTSAISAITALGSSIIAPLSRSPATLFTALAMRGVDTDESELNQALIKIAHLARGRGSGQPVLNPADIDLRQFENNPNLSQEFKEALANFMAEFGHRALYEPDLGWPRYTEDPTSLQTTIRRYIRSENLEGNQNRQEFTWNDLAEPPTGLNRVLPWRRAVAAILVKALRRLLIMRDDLNRARGRAMTACRQWDLALGQKWVSQRWLAEPDDIFWLALDEIERTLMIEGDMGVTLSSIVRARKDTYQTYAQTDMPFGLQDSQIPFLQPGIGLTTEAISEVIMGLAISPGQIQGPVLVLRQPDHFEQPVHNSILVLPSTDPAWLPLLHQAQGLIVETGGLLSHGSVIAREYGLPAVANIPNATRRFRTGDRVLVDGSTGIVQFLEAAP